MSTGATSIVAALVLNEQNMGTNPVIRRIILERFLWARQNAAQRVSEKSTQDKINVTTYLSYDSNTKLICEDVVVESRPRII